MTKRDFKAEYTTCVATGAPVHMRVNGKPQVEHLVYLQASACRDLWNLIEEAAKEQFGDSVQAIVFPEDETFGLIGVPNDDDMDFVVLDFAVLLRAERR